MRRRVRRTLRDATNAALLSAEWRVPLAGGLYTNMSVAAVLTAAGCMLAASLPSVVVLVIAGLLWLDTLVVLLAFRASTRERLQAQCMIIGLAYVYASLRSAEDSLVDGYDP